MNLIQVNFAELYIPIQLLIQLFLVDHCPEGFLYFLACLHDVSLNYFVFNFAALLELQHYPVFFVDPLHLTVFNIVEYAFPHGIHALSRLHFPLLHIHDLTRLKNVLKST